MLRKIALLGMLVSGVAAAFPWYINGGYRGADLMTPQGRQEYVARLQSMKTLNECEGYMKNHEVDLEKRAVAAHVTLPPVSGDPCQVMLQMGRIRG